MDLPKKDRLVELEHELYWLPGLILKLLPHFFVMALSSIVGGAASILCDIKERSHEEVPLWLDVVQWGGCGLGVLIILEYMVTMQIFVTRHKKLIADIEDERLWRGLEPLSGLSRTVDDNDDDDAKKAEVDSVVELEHKIKNWRHPSTIPRYAGLAIMGMWGASALIWYLKSWRGEELGSWFYVSFWGGLLLGVFTLSIIFENRGDFQMAVKKLERERVRRVNALRWAGGKAAAPDAGIC